MANKRLTTLTEATTLAWNTLMYFVLDPAGTPESRKAQLLTLLSLFNSAAPDGAMLNGRISPTVSSSDLVVAIKTYAGTDPSATDPVYVKINGTVRSITAALSITLADGTNWFNSGSAELGTLEVDYFTYLVWDSNSSAVAVAISRLPFGRTVNATDFSTTNTSEKHLSGYSNYTVGDDVVNIGRFAAILSLTGTSHLWTVPTYTNLNLVNHPIFETRVLTWVPTHTRVTTPYTNVPTVSSADYQIVNTFIKIDERHTQNATPGGSGFQRFTLPITAGNIFQPAGLFANETTANLFLAFPNNPANTINLYKYDGTAEATASQTYHGNISLPLRT